MGRNLTGQNKVESKVWIQKITGLKGRCSAKGQIRIKRMKKVKRKMIGLRGSSAKVRTGLVDCARIELVQIESSKFEWSFGVRHTV